MTRPRFIYHLTIQCSPEMEDEFNAWYDDVHIPLVMRGGMLKAISRYRVTDAIETSASTYLTICEFDDRASFEKWLASDILAEAKADREKTMGGKDVVWTSRTFYEPIGQFGQ
jgi:antibiotic biosynthesis monooxygenase (ABM) superfamily enzyme